MGQAGLSWGRLLAGLAIILCVAEPAVARQRLVFTPGKHDSEAVAPSLSPRSASRPNGHRMSAGEELEPPPQPGAGFKMEDGILTYPAPARFQPKNLKPL